MQKSEILVFSREGIDTLAPMPRPLINANVVGTVAFWTPFIETEAQQLDDARAHPAYGARCSFMQLQY